MIDITNISDMTPEQLADLIKDAAGQISDLEAERDSLKDEQKKTGEELQRTKSLNFTLARTIDTSKGKQASAEETLHNMFN